MAVCRYADERKRPKHEPIPAFPAKLAAASKKPEPREARDSKRPEAAAKAPVPEVARGSAHSRLSGAEKSREPASRALVIEGLKRPFSIVTLKNFLGETGDFACPYQFIHLLLFAVNLIWCFDDTKTRPVAVQHMAVSAV